MALRALHVVLLAAAVALVVRRTRACTGIILQAGDGAAVPGRTMEFASAVVGAELIAVPKGTTFTSLALQEGKRGYEYTTEYGAVGATGMGLPIFGDGLNEAGLYFGAFFFATTASFAPLTKENEATAVSSEEVGNLLLGTCASVADVRRKLKEVTVVTSHMESLGGPAPLYYVVVDKHNKRAVLQYTDEGKLRVFDAPLGAVANDPGYDWMMTNARNYIGLTPNNRGNLTINGVELAPFGQGSGLFGLPGDGTSPSRFLRAVAYANSLFPEDIPTADKAVFELFHVLNNFDIPSGSVRAGEQPALLEQTAWTTVADTRSKKYYFKTRNEQTIEVVDVKAALKAMKKAGRTEVVRVPMDTGKGFVANDRSRDFANEVCPAGGDCA